MLMGNYKIEYLSTYEKLYRDFDIVLYELIVAPPNDETKVNNLSNKHMNYIKTYDELTEACFNFNLLSKSDHLGSLFISPIENQKRIWTAKKY